MFSVQQLVTGRQYFLVLIMLIYTFPPKTRATSAPSDWANGISATYPAIEIKRFDGFHSAYIAYVDEDTKKVANKSEVGTYGEGYVGPMSGYVHHVRSKNDPKDHTGCELPLFTTNPKHQGPFPPTNEPWIALIKRGKCNFEVKVDNAYKSNASGVLVYDDRDKDHLDRMKLSNLERNISAVFTYKWKGEEIAQLVDNGSRVRLNITVGAHSTKPFPTINRTSVLFVSISFIVLMIISLTWLVFYYVQRFRYIHAKDKLSRQLCNAAKKALSKIPTKNIKANDKEIEGDGECCAVCIEPYKISDVLRILPCRHEFHKYCIDPWLLEHRTCPMCKMDILKHYGFVFTGSQESILHVDIEEAIPTDSPPVYLQSPALSSSTHNERQISRASSRNDTDSLRSSRATTPDELTPSLEESRQQEAAAAVNSYTNERRGNTTGMCVNCMAAPIATESEIRKLEKEHLKAATMSSSTTSTTSDNYVQTVLTSPCNNSSQVIVNTHHHRDIEPATSHQNLNITD